MTKQLPTIKKTKKSSYKPLSKLNEDNLTDLKRVEKPEYTSRIFFHNTSVRTQLQDTVNIWFRHHQQTMALINRQQRTVYNLMCRVQRDIHRVKKAEYLRRQQEIRANMKQMQVQLLQRRVVQKFRRNADNKMAPRGLQSLAGLKLTAQLRPESVQGLAPDDPARNGGTQRPAALLESISDYAAIASENTADCEEGIPKGKVTENSSHSELHPPSPSTQTCAGKENASSYVLATHHNDKCKENENKNGTNNTASSQQNAMTSQRTSAIKPPDPDSYASSNASSLDSSPNQFSLPGITSREGSSGVIQSVVPSLPSVDSPTEQKNKGQVRDGTTEKSSQDAQFPVFMDTRVMEVGKSGPGSPTVVARTRRTARGTPKASISTTTPSRTRPEDSVSAVPAHPSTPTEQDKTKTTTDPPGHGIHPSPPPAHLGADQSISTSHVLHQDPPVSMTKAGLSSEVSKSTDVKPGEAEVVALRDASGGKTTAAVRAGQGVAEERRQGDGGPGGMDRVHRSLASKVRLDRQQEARRRAKLLDDEPLIQYYRSTRGTLQPLQTKASRRQFSMPTGRHKHRQSKLLKQEQQKGLERRQDIDKFFADLFSRQLGQPKPETAEDTTELRSNHLELLLKKMRQQNRGRAPTVDWNSVEQLTKCQYLRFHHWQPQGQDPDKGAAEQAKLTSWASAETQLKKGCFHSPF